MIGLTALCFAAAAPTVDAQAQQYIADYGQEITIKTGAAASADSGSAVSALGGGKISGSGIIVSSKNTDGSGAIFAAGNASLVSLDGVSTITTNSVGVLMTNGGAVTLGSGSEINLSGSKKGSVGILFNGSAATPVQSGITININGAARTDKADINAWIGVAMIGASDSASFDKLTIKGDSVDTGAFVRNGASLKLTNSDITINGSMPEGKNTGFYVDGTQLTISGNKQTALVAYDRGRIDLEYTNITVNNPGGKAILAWLDTIVNVVGGTITVSSAKVAESIASAMFVNSTSKLDITGTTIKVSGDAYTGIELRASSNLATKNMILTMTGNGTGTNQEVVGVESSNSTAELTDSTITAKGDQSWGIDVNAAGSAKMTGGSITMQGANSNGVVLRSPKASSSFTGTNIAITTTGANSNGINIGNFSKVDLTNTTIDALGDNNRGIALGGKEVTVTMSGGRITADREAVYVVGEGANLTFNKGAEIASTSNLGFLIGSDNVVVKVSGSSSVKSPYKAFNISGDKAEVSIDDGSLIESAKTAFDISGSDVALNISNGSRVASTSGAAFVISGTNAVLDLSNATEVSGGNGILLDVTDAGSVDLTATNGVRLNGDIQAATVDSATVSLSNGVTWTGVAHGVGATAIDDNSSWLMTGNSDVASLQLGNSEIRFQAPVGNPAEMASYKTLTARGDYAGNNGLVVLNTFLGTDNSPTDRLVVQGNTSGSSVLSVVDTGGPGGLTTGDGIMVVDVQGASDGEFMLAHRVAGGPGNAYEYLLFHGGNAAAGGDAGDGNWYLRNTYTPPPPPDEPDPGPGPAPVPIVRPEVPTYTVIPPLAIEFGYSMLGTLHDRVGATFTSPLAAVAEERVVYCKDPKQKFRCTVKVPVATVNDEQRWFGSGWARAIGNRGFHEPDDFFQRGPNYDYTFGGIEAGMDVWARQQADGALDKAGFYIGYGQVAADVKNQFGGKAGTVDMDAYTLAGYWTHYAASGWYTDAVIQGTWYATDAKSVLGEKIEPDGFGILGSLEGGYTFKLGSGFTLEPQAQIVYQNVSFDKARDSFSFVNFNDGDSLRGRLGLRLAKTWNIEDAAQPRLITGWLRANVWHEFMGDTKTVFASPGSFSSMSMPSALGGTWGEINAGVTAQISDKVNLFATGSYNRSFDDDGSQGWAGRLGMTVKW